MIGQRPPFISFLTDFGLDGAAATCRGVMIDICPTARIVDISHTVPKYAIADGAMILRAALPYMPLGVHVAVVDPGVGTTRRPIGILTVRGDVLIGPDNGLLLRGADALGGIETARELTNRELWLPVRTSTFHGRDIFAPTAAHLAAGDAAFATIGAEIETASLMPLTVPAARIGEGILETEVTYVDSFGNLRLAGGADSLASALGDIGTGAAITARVGKTPLADVTYAPSFGHVAEGATLLYVDSTGDLALADNQGNLATRLGAERGAHVSLERGD